MSASQPIGRFAFFVGLLVLSAGCSNGGRGGGSSPTGPSATVSVMASPTSIAIAGVTQVVATVMGADGTPLAGEGLRFESSLGILETEGAVTGADGRARTQLFGTETGTATVAAQLLSTGARAEIEVSIGQGNRIEILAAPSTVGTGDEGRILVRVRPRDGSNPPRDLAIELSASLGTLASPSLRTDDLGTAQTTFRAGDTAGTAQISVTIPSTGEGASTTLAVVESTRSLALEVSPALIDPRGRATVTVAVFEEDGAPAAAVAVDLETTLGRLASARISTSGSGIASTTFDPLGAIGTAVIEASIGGELMASSAVDVVEAVLAIRANPQQIAAAGGVAAIVVSGLTAGGQPVAEGSRFRLSATLGTLAATTLTANANGLAQTSLAAGGQTGIAEVRAVLDGTEASASIFVVLAE